MTRSLKERYELKRVKLLQERVKRIDEHVLAEHRFAQLLVEAMDEEDLNKVQAIVQKLSKIKNPALPALKNAIEQAEAELAKYTAGGPLTKGWARMKKLVGVDNPVVKVTTFADALEKGFSQLPKILKNNGIDLESADLSQSLATILASSKTTTGGTTTNPKTATGAKSDQEMGNTSYAPKKEADGKPDNAPKVNIEGKLKNIIDQLRKALSPGGIYGVFKKVPYIDSAQLAQELVKAPLKVFSQIVQVVNSGTKAAEVAPNLKDQVTGQGGAETKGTQTAASSAATDQTGQATPTKDPTVSTGSTDTGQQTPKPQGGGAGTNYAAAKQKLMPLLKNAKKMGIDQLVKKLVDAGLDVSKL